jgi:hypothetical protein
MRLHWLAVVLADRFTPMKGRTVHPPPLYDTFIAKKLAIPVIRASIEWRLATPAVRVLLVMIVRVLLVMRPRE